MVSFPVTGPVVKVMCCVVVYVSLAVPVFQIVMTTITATFVATSPASHWEILLYPPVFVPLDPVFVASCAFFKRAWYSSSVI
jgi:hypothetical protein